MVTRVSGSNKTTSHADPLGYNSWKKLGDVASSLFALGYHEDVGQEESTPRFLLRMRRDALRRAYSADKNVSIFLGRPPRIARKHCPALAELRDRQRMRRYESFSYRAETLWSAVCATYKEDILDLRKEDLALRATKASWVFYL
jgi:hypothetical protein